MLFLTLFLLTFAVRTDHALLLTQNTYAAILFRADTGTPDRVEFTTSGNLPPGMIFENVPCHKPGQQNCPAMASANGLYLDGVPETSGSYHLSIRAQMGDQTASQDFTVVVKKP